MSVTSIKPRYSFMLAAARAFSARRELLSEEICIARHMARDGASTLEIAAVLNLPWKLPRLQRHLYKLNIRPRDVSDRAHRGELTTIPNHHSAHDKQTFRPKMRAAE